ncbi:hypothetical protein F4780DRAFT_313787 [Xylariomycetidae sp. FL0641]|nr:hypothetical protein F4780DRAFT_313787 [Xylariomycetidae sp. FL0641]
MHAHTALAILGLASSAVASSSPAQLNSLRSLHADNALAARDGDMDDGSGADMDDGSDMDDGDDDSGMGECQDSALSLLGSVPTPSGQLLSYIESYAATATLDLAAGDPAALCTASAAAIPPSLSSAYAAYETQAESWFAANADALTSLVSVCSTGAMGAQISAASSAYASAASACLSATATATATASGSGSGGAKPTSTSTAGAGASQTSGGAGSDVTQVPEGAATRPAGLYAAVAAAAGVLGAAILL